MSAIIGGDAPNGRLRLWLLVVAAGTLLLTGFLNPSRLCHIERATGSIVHDFAEVRAQAIVRDILVGPRGRALPECIPAMKRTVTYGGLGISMALAAGAFLIPVILANARYRGRHKTTLRKGTRSERA